MYQFLNKYILPVVMMCIMVMMACSSQEGDGVIKKNKLSVVSSQQEKKTVTQQGQVCPVIFVSHKADQLISKTNDLKDERFTAVIKVDHITCKQEQDLLVLEFDILVNGLKQKGLYDATNVQIPVEYTIKVDLRNNDNQHEQIDGTYFMTLKSVSDSVLIAKQARTLQFPLEGYRFDLSKVTLGFQSEDSTLVIH